MRRRSFWMAVAALLVLGGFAAGGSLPGRLLWARPQAEVRITEETVNGGTEAMVTDIRKPVVSDLGDVALEQALSDRVRAQVDAARAASEAEAAALWREAGRDGFEPWGYVFYADYEAYCTRGVLSMRVTTDLDNGGTGLPHTVYYNIDIKAGRWLALGNLFVSDDYKDVIGAYIHEQIKNDERFLPEEFSGVSSKTSFYIKDGRLYIAFAKYEIASGMTGEPVFAIPPKLLRGLVKPRYAGLLL